ncbi:MAG: universal stress protein [Planctomycetota bacterium]
MNIKRILCPVDFSEFNQAANEYASMLAKSTGARLIYFHCALPDAAGYGSPYVHEDPDDVVREAQREIEEISPTVPGVAASYVVELGMATDGIIRYANENDIDLIVMGTHGRTGFRRVLMGSVAEAVVRKADCPVLAVKSKAAVANES